MKNLKHIFFKYHRLIGIILAIPVFLTALTGIGYIIFDEWLHMEEFGEILLKIHTMEIIGLEDIYPIIVGIGLIWMVTSGIIMSNIIAKRQKG